MNVTIWVAFGGVAIAALALIYNAWKDTKQHAFSDGSISEILRGIESRLKSLDESQKENDRSLKNFIDRLSRTEDSTKSAHHRLDEHEQRIGNLEKLK